MSSKRSHWGRRLGVVVLLVGGLLLAGYGPEVALANHETACNRENTSCWPVLHGNGRSSNTNNGSSSTQPNPLDEILKKLTELLTLYKNHPATDLSGVTQNWDKKLPPASRYTVLADFNNEAVRDDETGLVWLRTSSPTTTDWPGSTSYCLQKQVGGRSGFRNAAVTELSSLLDLTLPPPYVPAGVFIGLQAAGYWSTTSNGAHPEKNWLVHFGTGEIFSNDIANSNYVLCVRGPMNEHSY